MSAASTPSTSAILPASADAASGSAVDRGPGGAPFWVALVLVPWTAFMLMAGAVVTSTGSGMATDTWPDAFGFMFPALRGGLFWEHGHRLWGMVVGLLTIALLVAVLLRDRRKGVRWLAIAALPLVLVQGVLGAATVWEKLKVPGLSIGHAFFGQAFFCVTVALLQLVSPRWPPRGLPDGRALPDGGTAAADRFLVALCRLALGVGFLQLLLGAILRHTRAGIAWHLSGALILLVVSWSVIQRVYARHRAVAALERPAATLVLVLCFQIALGFAAYVIKYLTPSRPEPHWTIVLLASAHVLGGALLLANLVVLALRSTRLCSGTRADDEAAPGSAAGGAP